jgi:hypothetical protein
MNSVGITAIILILLMLGGATVSHLYKELTIINLTIGMSVVLMLQVCTGDIVHEIRESKK